MSLSNQEYIDYLQRFIIVHSYIYYELNRNVISDREYDIKSKELTKYKNDFPELWKTSEYYQQFGDDYDGSTGFTLYYELNKSQQKIISSIANCILRGKSKCLKESKTGLNDTLITVS